MTVNQDTGQLLTPGEISEIAGYVAGLRPSAAPIDIAVNGDLVGDPDRTARSAASRMPGRPGGSSSARTPPTKNATASRPVRRDVPEQPVLSAIHACFSGQDRNAERRLHARLHHGQQSHEVIALSATGHLGMAGPGQLNCPPLE
jgi:hypothetical protein